MSQPNNIPSNIAVPGGAPTDQQSTSTYLTQLGTRLNNWVVQAANATNYLLAATSSENEGANVVDYGADPTGGSDCKAAFQSAMAASALIVIPTGTYRFASPLKFTIPAGKCVQFQGAGSESTLLLFPTGDGWDVTFGSQASTIKVFGVTFGTAGQGVGNGISITQTGPTGIGQGSSLLQDCSFRGSDAYGGSNYWTAGISINGASAIDYISCNFYGPAAPPRGIGVNLIGNSVAVSVVHNFIGCNFSLLDRCIVYGTFVQGVTLTASNFTGSNYGVNVTGGGSSLDQLAVSTSQFYCYNAGIIVGTALSNFLLTGNLFIVAANAVAVQIVECSSFNLTGNGVEAIGATTNGFVIQTYVARAGVITGNTFFDVTTGVWLQTPSQFVNVQANSYSGCPNTVVNQGTNNTVGVATQ